MSSILPIMQKCKVNTCDRNIVRIRAGYCIKHYQKFLKYGNPLMGKDIEFHGLTKTPEHRAWVHMKRRCRDPNYNRYEKYHERGIRVCERWEKSFLLFLEDMGNRPDSRYSIERINNYGDYEPLNCKWAIPKEQARNRTNNRYITIDGATKTLEEWMELSPIKRGTITARLYRYKWPLRKALGI